MQFSELDMVASYKFKDPNPLLVDVGAHEGGVSLTFAEKDWQVIAFEPEKANFNELNNNLSKFKTAILINKAVSDNTGQLVPFYVSDEHYGIHSLQPFHKTHNFAYEVETIRLDDALERLDVKNVTFLKIDIEGADFLALKGFDFKKIRPEIVMVEFMDERSLPHFGYTHHDMVEFMKEKGYVTFVSEWAQFDEYGRKNGTNSPHTWIQCSPYPLDHEPVWGNLIFVPEKDRDRFYKYFQRYIKKLKNPHDFFLRINNIKQYIINEVKSRRMK